MGSTYPKRERQRLTAQAFSTLREYEKRHGVVCFSSSHTIVSREQFRSGHIVVDSNSRLPFTTQLRLFTTNEILKERQRNCL